MCAQARSTNWNISVFHNHRAFSNLRDGCRWRASSQASGVDFVVGDFNSGHDPVGLYYPKVTRASGSANGTVEWDSGANSLVVNGPLVNRTHRLE